jgi:hypothetical protein
MNTTVRAGDLGQVSGGRDGVQDPDLLRDQVAERGQGAVEVGE